MEAITSGNTLDTNDNGRLMGKSVDFRVGHFETKPVCDRRSDRKQKAVRYT